MEQVAFNQEGFDKLREQLYLLPKEEFEKQLESIQFKTRDWIKENFILKGEQLEYLDLIPDEFITEIGLITAIAIDYKTPFTLTTPQEYSPPVTSKRPVEFYAEGGGTYSPGQGPRISDVEFGVKLGF